VKIILKKETKKAGAMQVRQLSLRKCSSENESILDNNQLTF